MSLINDAKSLGNGSQNLILETAGRIYVKVADRFYELNFRDQGSGKVEQNVTNNTTIKEEADLSNYVTKKDLKASLAQYITKRDWQDVKQTQKMLEEALLEGFTDSINPITVQTMQMIVGSDQLQFEFIRNIQENPYIVVPHNFGIEDGRLFCDPGIILHHTIDGPQAVQPGANNSTQSDTKYYCRWTVQDPDTADHVTWFDFGADDQAYYLYIKAQKLSLTEEQKNNPTDWQTKTGNATFYLSDTAVELDPEDGYYYFLYAIINSDTGDGRSIGTMNGFTEILPGQITAYIFKSADGVQFVDFLNKQFHIGYAAEPGELSPSGSANNGSYMHWDEHNGLVIKGNITVTGGELQETLDSLQAQIDDEVQAWFSDDPDNDNVVTHCRPTLNTWPAKNWTTNETKKEHNGDLYLITDGEYQGEMYRFGKHDGVWGWIQISDNAVAEALNAAHNAQQTADTATAKINSWIDDGVISPTELIGLREEYEFVQSDWNNIHKEADLYGLLNSTEYTNYNAAKVAYYNWLGKIITSYDNADEDVLDEFGNVDLDACKTKYSLPSTFKSTMETYYSRRTAMYEKIATSVNTGISNAQTTASQAQTTANTVTQHVTKSLSDGVLTQDEISVLQTYLKSLADQYNALTGAYDDLIAQANDVLSDSDLRQTDPEWIAVNAAKNALNTATTGTKAILDAKYQALVTAAQNIIAQGVTPVGSTNTNLASLKTAFDGAATNFTTAIGNYTEDIKELEIAIANANKMLSVAGYKYLKEAIEQGATTIAGGLILSNLLELRTIVEGESGEVTAGINGIVMDTTNKTDIAAWFGGEMLDKANYYDYAYNQQSQRYEWTLKPNKTDPGTIAKTVFRHDGTGYIANGNIGWNSDGSGWVAGGALWWNAQGVPTIGGNITIDGSNETFITLSNKVSQILSWFDFDQANSAIYVKNNYGFYSNSFVSAGGVSTTQGSEGTNLEVVWASLTNQLPDTTYNNVKIVPAHIPIATTTTIGGVKIGSGLSISQDGTLTSASGTVTSIGLEMPQGFTISNSPITEFGNITVEFSSGYSLPTTTKQNQWDTAYGWGDHAQAGYAAGSDVVTLQGYFTNGVANSALRLSGNSTYSLWGVEYWADGIPKSVTARPTLYIGTTQVQIGATAQALTGITYGELSSYLKIGMGSPAATTEGSSAKENRRIYFGDTNHYVELTKEGYFHFSHGLYSDSFVSAGGVSDTSGSSGIDPDAMWELLATSGNEQIDESHLATALTNYVNNVTVSGTGNYISNITKSGHTITVTKATLPVQTIYALTIKNSGGTTELTYTPNSAAATLTLTAAMVGLGDVSNMAPSDYFTDFSNITTGADANKVSITIGGVTKKLEIGYVTKAQKDASGNIITSSYGASLSAASNALKLIAKDGTTTLSTITAANLVTVLGNTAVGRATSDANGNNIYNTYVSGVAVGTSTNSTKLAITKAGNTTYITVPYSLTTETTADTTNTLYLVGVTSNATTTLKRDTSITMKGDALTAGKYYLGTSGTTITDWSNGQYLEWDNDNKAWHLIGNFYADGFVSAGGLNTSGSGGSEVHFLDYDTIKTLTTDPDLTTATAWATHLLYNDIFGSGSTTIASRITALENSSTNVSYTSNYSSGATIGAIYIDGVSNPIYNPWSSSNSNNNNAILSNSNGIASAYAVSEGRYTRANGYGSHAEGYFTYAYGNYSHAEGYYTQISSEGGHAEGRYNLDNYDLLHAVGNGDNDSNRKNVFEIYNDGNIYIDGVNDHNGGNSTIHTNYSLNNLLDISPLLDSDWTYIFNEYEPVNWILCIDDFTDAEEDYDYSVEGIAQEHGISSQNLVQSIYDCPECYGVNQFMDSGRVFIYNNNTYRLFEGRAWESSGYLSDPILYGLLPMDTTFNDLYNMSMDANINNRNCPFVALLGPDLSERYSINDDLDNRYSLVTVWEY